MNRKIISKISAVFATICLICLVNSCAINPVTGKRELMFMSTSEEVALGKQADPEIIAEFGLYDNEEIATYIDQLGQEMARISHRPELEYHFRLLDSPVINAFALPGGYVYFTRGILAYMNNEAELAGVLGHEIGHITARHGAKQYSKAQLAQLGLGIGYSFSKEFQKFGDYAELGLGLLFLKFSRDQERQSDQLGVEYSTKIGEDATNMSNFFGTLNRLQDLSGQSLPGWFSTHPNPEDREAATHKLAMKWQKKVPASKFKVNRDKYLNLVDGIVFGEDPRQGFVENNFFYHPTLDFQFPVPTDWQLVNTPQQVQMLSKNQDAAILFTLSQEPNARQAANKFLTNTRGRLIQSDHVKVNQMNTEIRVTDVEQEQGTLRVLSYFIEKDKRVFVFHGFCEQGKFNQNQSAFKYAMTNFDRLRNQAAKQVMPTRLDVVTVRRGGQLKDVLEDYPKGKLSIEQLAILNGMKLTDVVRAGDKVKVMSQ